MPPKRKAQPAKEAPQKPQEGKNGCKRRPKDIGDYVRVPEGEILAPESIEGIRWEGPPGQRYKTFQVRWLGFPPARDTWGPIENLSLIHI